MSDLGNARWEIMPKLTAAILLLCAGSSVAWTFLKFLDGKLFFYWEPWQAAAANLNLLLFLCASAIVFIRPRLGYALGVIASLMALSWFLQAELSPDNVNSWTGLNYESSIQMLPQLEDNPSKMKIISVFFLAVAFATSLLRMLPPRWSLRESPLCRSTWPAVAVGFLVLAVWFGCSVTPYHIPAFDHPMGMQFRILHVQKHGLHFDETTVSEERNGVAWIERAERRLFQYRFYKRIASTALGEVSPTTMERIRTFIQSPTLLASRTANPEALRAWNAEGWYVVLKDSKLISFTSEWGTVPPKEVIELFHEIENLPSGGRSPFFARDVCLGFCYDPIAALGFQVLPQRLRLLDSTAAATADREE
jgi:hypothetical protein